jgi:heat shock protein HtpX
VKDPKALASALRKLEYGNKARPMRGNPSAASLFIVNPFSGQALLSLLSTHPPLEKRIAILEQMKL